MNIKQQLRNVLMNTEITDLTADKRVYFIHSINAKPPYVNYAFIDEYGEEFAENEEIATTYNIQVDVFSKTDYTELEEKIKEKMTAAGFNRTMAADFYEKDTKLFHKAMRFIYTKTE